MPTRRSLLAAAVPLLLGGCLADERATDGPPPTPVTETTRSTAETDRSASPDCTRGYTVTLSPFAPTEQLTLPLRPAQERLFGRIVDEGNFELRTYGRPPIRTDRYVGHDGAYYRVEYDRTGYDEVPARRADLSWELGREAPAGASVVAYGDLPAVDRAALDLLIRGPEYSREGLPAEGLSVRDAPAPYPRGTADSTLVGAGTRWVAWDDRVYEVAVTTEETTIERRTYEYRAPRVADSAAAFRELVADRYLAVLDDLSPAARSVLDAARDGGDGEHEDCDDPSAGYESLKRRLRRAPELPVVQAGAWYVAYDGERYLLEIGSWVV